MPTIDLAYAMRLPPEQAIAYFRAKGYTISFDWHEVWEAAHARAFTVAGVMKLDVLTEIREALDRALSEGRTLTQFVDELEPYLKKKGWWGRGAIVDPDTGEITGKRLNARRLETIYHTNLQSSYMAGRFKEQLTNAEYRPYWQYVAIMDSRTRPAHRALHGKVFRYDDPFWDSFYPPNGWRCRCRVRTYSARDVDKRGLWVESSQDNMIVVDQPINPAGDIRQVPGYRDPSSGKVFTTDAGFAYNPGKAGYQPDLTQYPPALAQQYSREYLQ